MNNKKKGSFFSFIFPYILIAGIIITILFMFNGFNRNQVRYLSEPEVLGSITQVDLDMLTNASNDKDKENATNNLNEKLDKSFLYKERITSLDISPKTNLINLTGYYIGINSSNKESQYAFSATISKDSQVILNYIVNNRYQKEADGTFKLDENGQKIIYFNKSILSYSDPYASNFWRDYFPTILIAGVLIILGVFLFSRMSNSINKSNNSALDFNSSRARREDASNVRFDDVAGCDECKAEMIELVDYLRQPQKYSKFGAKLPKGVLLVGPPGTGKTLLAKAVAGEAKVPFYSISGSDFVEMFVGVGAGRVRDMFKKAKQTAPCLIFIDEIDAVGRQRGTGMGGGNDEREQTLNQLLVEMDGFSDNAGIIVIAATNRDDVLDPALLRAGRFDRKITVDLPDKEGREAILKVHARNKTISKEVDFGAIAKRTVGFSGADLANILNEAAILAVRENKTEVTTKDIDEAIDRRIAGPAKSSKSLSEHEKRVVAFHEAGHAIIGLKIPYSDKVQKVTIIPRGRTGGHVLMTPEEDRFLMTKGELEARIIGYLGGRSSEEVFFDDVSTGASNDIEVATRIARAMVSQYGMSSLGPIQYESDQGSVFLGRDYTSAGRNFSSQVANEIDAEIRKIIDHAHQIALKTIKDNKDKVTLIANVLIEKETINAEEIDYLMKYGELPPEKTVKTEEVNSEVKTEEVNSTLEENKIEEVKKENVESNDDSKKQDETK